MSTDQLTNFFQNLQDKFLSGESDTLVTQFATPLVVYSVAGVVVFRNKEEILKRIDMYREALQALSVVSGSFELVSEDPLINNRLRVTLRTTYYGQDGVEVTSSLARYFFVRRDEDLIVEMIEYLEAALPTEEIEDLIH